MADEFNGIVAGDAAELASNLRQEFIDESLESVHALDVDMAEVEHGRRPLSDVLQPIRRLALVLRGQASNLGMRVLGTVAHRLEDYLANVKVLPPRALGDLRRFLDVLRLLQNSGWSAANLGVIAPPWGQTESLRADIAA